MFSKALLRNTVSLAYGRCAGLCKALLLMFSLVVYAIPAQSQDTITIVAFGDSLTQGYGLPEADGFVPQLQTWLNGQGVDVRLINAGVSGDTTAGGLARITWTLDENVNAVIVALGGNDLLRGIFPESSRANLDGILTIISSKELPVMLVGLPGPSNYGPEFKTEFDNIYPALAMEHRAILYSSFFEGLGEDPAEMLDLMQADGVHPNASGVAKIVAHMGPVVLELIENAAP